MFEQEIQQLSEEAYFSPELYNERFSGIAATQAEVSAFRAKVDSLKKQFYNI